MPKQVVHAVNLLWLSLLMELPLKYIHDVRVDGKFTIDHIFMVMVLFFICVNIFTLKAKNWARMMQLILAILGWTSYVYDVEDFLQSGLAEKLINVAISMLDIVAIYFLFSKPGKDWFIKKAKKV